MERPTSSFFNFIYWGVLFIFNGRISLFSNGWSLGSLVSFLFSSLPQWALSFPLNGWNSSLVEAFLLQWMEFLSPVTIWGGLLLISNIQIFSSLLQCMELCLSYSMEFLFLLHWTSPSSLFQWTKFVLSFTIDGFFVRRDFQPYSMDKFCPFLYIGWTLRS